MDKLLSFSFALYKLLLYYSGADERYLYEGRAVIVSKAPTRHGETIKREDDSQCHATQG